MMSILLFGCTEEPLDEMNTKIIYPDGLPAIGISKFINDNQKIDG